MSMTDSFKSNKKLLANMAKLGGSIGISCPKEWIQGIYSFNYCYALLIPL